MTTILFLEPRDECRNDHTRALRSAGFDVTSVRDPRTALESLETRRPQVFVARLDQRTRDEHLSLCRRIKNDARTKFIPILLTADNMTGDDVGLATDPGVLVLAVPPDNSAKLVAAIQGVLGVHRPMPLAASLDQEEENGERSA